jgi:peptide/nickel transport system substrate-binding protein
MKAAGYEEGFGVTMDCPNNRYVADEAICIALVHMLAKINIRVQPRIVPKARFFERVTAVSKYDSSMSLLGWTPGSMDGLNILENIAGCRDAAGNGALFNLGGYCNRKVDHLAGRIRAEPDSKQRDQLLAEAFRLIHEDAGLIPLHQQVLVWGVSNNVVVDQRADNQIRFEYMRKIDKHASAR